MYDLGRSGAIGNFLRTWYSPTEFKNSDYKGDFTLRHRTIVGHPIRYYKMPYAAFDTCVEAARILGVDCEKELIIQALENLLSAELIIQGELVRYDNKLCFFYSFMPEALRIAMLHPSARQVYGVDAEVILRDYVPAEDVDDLKELLDLYPEHVIEFSTYSKRLGMFQRQTIIWEVRLY